MAECKNKGWSVTLAGLGINLALGILYTWSIFKLSIKESILSGDGQFTWNLASLNDPYAVCCFTFALAMIFAGRLQDKTNPRATAMIGGVLAGLGLIMISLSNDLLIWILGFGVLTGSGLGFAYASATPPAIKWFPASKTGMIAGIVVAGFGLASVYIAPLATYLIGKFGLNLAMMIFGTSFIGVICVLSIFLVNPPEGYVPVNNGKGKATSTSPAKAVVELAPLQMLKTATFYRLWFMYFVGAGAGLFIIGGVAVLAKQSMGDLAWAVVAFLAVGNAGGRIIAGILSDKVGRSLTLSFMMMFQTLLIVSLLFVNPNNAVTIVTIATFIGFNYGTNLSLFPSFTKDLFGLSNFGSNYGLMFTAWGAGGLVFPRIAQMMAAKTGTLDSAYMMTATLLFLCGIFAYFSRSKAESNEAMLSSKLAQPLVGTYSEN